MLSTDSQLRTARLSEIVEILGQKATPEDRELVLALAPVVFAEVPDRLALGLPAPALAARLLSHFRFIAREMPPAHQLFKGLPGIHVSARNPGEAEAAAMGGGQGVPLETTVVETHTADTPFIFESLKNYFQKAGLRVFSAIHPVFTVRRQWERVVWIGGAHEEGSRECYCHFQIEPVESKERLRHIEHQVFSVLKCVFLAVQDFRDMGRICTDLAGRLRSRRGNEEELQSARAFLGWLKDDNFIFMGTVSYRAGADGTLDRQDETATGTFLDEALLPVVFPGVMERVESHLQPAPGHERIVDIDYCNNGTAIYHLEPVEDIVVREWGPDGQLQGATLLLGRFARGAFAQRADRIPLLKEKHDWLLRESQANPNSHTWREIRAAFNQLPEDGALLRRRHGPEADHRPHRLHDGRRRDRRPRPQGPGLRGALHRVLAAPLRLPDGRSAAPRPRGQLRARGLRHLRGLRGGHPLPLLLRRGRARASGGGGGGAPAHRPSRHQLGRPGGGGARAQVRRARGPAASSGATSRRSRGAASTAR